MFVENWKPVIGYEGCYEVSDKGRVRSLYFNKILKPNMNDRGYLDVALCKNRQYKHFRINRLVAMTFIPNPNNLSQVNHKDGDKQNNCVDNLEWCTQAYNNLHANRTGLRRFVRGENSPHHKLTWEIVRAIRCDYANGMRQVDICRKYNLIKSVVHNIVKNKTWEEINNDC